MRFSELKDVLRKQPFEPFRVRLTTGDSYVIRHPEFAALLRSSIVIGISSGRDGVPDRFVQCDLLHVVALEPVNGAKPKSKRGPRRK